MEALSLAFFRFLALRKWALERPGIIITVTGGAADFDLSDEAQDTMFKVQHKNTSNISYI